MIYLRVIFATVFIIITVNRNIFHNLYYWKVHIIIHLVIRSEHEHMI